MRYAFSFEDLRLSRRRHFEETGLKRKEVRVAMICEAKIRAASWTTGRFERGFDRW